MALVLVVDDEPDILLLHRLTLENEGHTVLLAADGVKALERIDADKPDVVVLDVQMPVLDGWGVLDQMRNRVNPPPVVVVSAWSSREDIERALSSGAASFLAKPFETDVLLSTIADLAALPRNP